MCQFNSKIVNGRPDILENVDTTTLTVWKCTNPKIKSGKVEPPELDERLKGLQRNTSRGAHSLRGDTARAGSRIPGKRKADDSQYYEDAKPRKLVKITSSGLNDTATYISWQNDTEGNRLDNFPTKDIACQKPRDLFCLSTPYNHEIQKRAPQRYLLKFLFTEHEVFDFGIDDTKATSDGYELMLGQGAIQS
ncbi:hypothetical protein BJV74DRAFT_881559 [Russula compacta]|nr:hypothetical protein BJV74DRAFT_881559 [Russula compacta]